MSLEVLTPYGGGDAVAVSETNAMPPPIPQELTDTILDCLQDSETSLAQCALGGFALDILDAPPLGEVSDLFEIFRDLLVDSPHLASHIRRLNIGLRPLDAEIDSSDALPTPAWQKIESSVREILPLLHALKYLALFPCGPSTHTFQLQPSVYDAFRMLLPQSLIFFSWRFPDCSPLTSFGVNAKMSLKFVECEFNEPISGFPVIGNLNAVELDRCTGLAAFSQHWIPTQESYTKYMAIKLAYVPDSAWTVSQALTRLVRSIDRGLTIVIDTDSPPLFSLDPFSHLQRLDLSFSETTPSMSISMEWLEMTFMVLVLPKGFTLHLSIMTQYFPFGRKADWEEGLHTALGQNCDLKMEAHLCQRNEPGGRIIKKLKNDERKDKEKREGGLLLSDVAPHDHPTIPTEHDVPSTPTSGRRNARALFPGPRKVICEYNRCSGMALDTRRTPPPSLPASSRVRNKCAVSETPNAELRILTARWDGTEGCGYKTRLCHTETTALLRERRARDGLMPL
ncbi:hypothetical protein B0H13DRAFT_1853009 [Mycena leptocephala]|nr:hypothetical protein B0H13DRAFT_1853009 [Mycena leptocephala]